MPNPKLTLFIENRLSENSCSPDIGHMSRHFDAVPVFVYGTHQKKFSEAYQMRGATFISSARTIRSSHMMYILDSNGWKEPVVFNMPLLQNTGCVLGEVYLMPVDELPHFDQVMSNGLWLRRSMEHIKYKIYQKNGKVEEAVTEAFVYLGDVEHWKKEKEAGNLKLTVRHIGSFPYYCFQPMDDKANRDIMKAAAEKRAAANSNTQERVMM